MAAWWSLAPVSDVLPLANFLLTNSLLLAVPPLSLTLLLADGSKYRLLGSCPPLHVLRPGGTAAAPLSVLSAVPPAGHFSDVNPRLDVRLLQPPSRPTWLVYKLRCHLPQVC